MKELADQLDAVRHAIKYRDQYNVYVVVAFDDERNPVEVFAEFSEPADHKSQFTHSGWNTATRMTTMCLRSDDPDMTLHKIVEQLDRASVKPTDIGGILAGVLKTYLPEVL